MRRTPRNDRALKLSAPRPARALMIALVLALALVGCGDGADEIQAIAEGEDAAVADYPEWLEKVYPPPDSETSVTRAVQVNHNIVTKQRQVRLIIDGVDVTTYAVETAPGLLEYDIDQQSAPVNLKPGQHTAVLELTRVTPGAGEGADSYDPQVHETIDRFAWKFTVL